MLIGIISDSHGHVARAAQAVEQLKSRGIRALIHCGDIGHEGVLLHLISACDDPPLPVYAVLGNVDLYDPQLARFPDNTIVHLLGRKGIITLDGKSLAIIHGDDPRLLMPAISSGQYDYVFTGHTHEASDERYGRTRVINPGALHRAMIPSCALLDLERDELTIVPLT